jgi:hypothetical protein
MNIVGTVLEIVKYVLPAAVVMASTYMLVKRFLLTETQQRQMAIFEKVQDSTLRLRLQAYERLVILIERINPRVLVNRVYDPSMTVLELRQMIVLSIMSEFEHNLSQQIYVSVKVWDVVKNVKEQEINMINQISKALNPEAPAKELHEKIFKYILDADGESPTDIALIILNEEVKKVMDYGSY